ncbi:MAG: ribosomal protein S18-alanine N-acetyltransferase [Bacillaceae bacterium]|nr:ribosomal protein S18-alanine N-acetyltransferase [Bacillaceae bacterium]
MAETIFKIRPMVLTDIVEVVVIEKTSFTSPWTKRAFIEELTKNNYANYTVLEHDGDIIGYCGIWVVIDDAQITTIAIKKEYRGQGLGEQLLLHSIDRARLLGATRVSLEVRVTNTVAQKLYKRLGFKKGGIRKNYYADNQEDALVMWVMLNENE